MVTLTNPVFWATYSTAAVLAVLAGSMRARHWWSRLLRLLLLLLSIVSAALYFMPELVSWLFEYPTSPHTAALALLPVRWALAVMIPLTLCFALGYFARSYFIRRAVAPTI